MIKFRHLAAAAAVISMLWSCENPVTPEQDDNGETISDIELSVSADKITYNPDEPDGNSFTVTSNVPWTANSDTGELIFSPYEGQAGETVVTVTGMTAGKTGSITITTTKRFSGDSQKTATVSVTGSESSGESGETGKVIYEDNLDKATYSSSTVYIDQWDDYINATGEGAADVYYTGMTVSIRNNFTSKGYPGASGKNAFNLGGDGVTLTVHDISLSPGQEKLELTFGVVPPQNSTFTPGTTLKLHVDFDGGESLGNELDFSVKQYGTWYFATCSFGITGGTPSSLNFMLQSGANGVRIDDLKLTVTDYAAQTVEYSDEVRNAPWPELPETVKENRSYKYITHRSTTFRSGKEVRNYSACYDTVRHNPVWVAYPCHPVYREGGYARTEPDPWRPDPEMTLKEQSIIFGSDWAEWPWNGASSATDGFQYWQTMSDGSNFTRGHLLRSADRSGNGAEINIQTFYPTNIAPETWLYPDIHGQLEDLLTDEWTCNDTTYVVSGCWYGDNSWFTYDACSWDQTSENSKICRVPTHQFKVYLRTRNGNTGKTIAECSAEELMAIGFWLPQDVERQGTISGGNLADFARSVDEIEALIGGEFNFFPEAPASVTATYNLSDWGVN